MSGIKISRQQIEQRIREEMRKKAEREAKMKAEEELLLMYIQCGKDVMKAYREHLAELSCELESISIYFAKKEELSNEMEQLMEEIGRLEVYCLVKQDARTLMEYREMIQVQNQKLSQKLLSYDKILAKLERKQEKANAKLTKKNQQLEVIAQQEKEIISKNEALILEREEIQIQECLKEYEQEYIHEVLTEAMESIGYNIIGSKISDEEADVQEYLFSYQEESAIHVIEQEEQITFEIVGTDSIEREPSEFEKVWVETLMHDFDDEYAKVKAYMRRKGITPRDGSELIIPPDESLVRIVNSMDYELESADSKNEQEKKKPQRRKMQKQNLKTF